MGVIGAFLIVSSLAHAAASSSGGSDGTRGGGDDVGVEFSATARLVLDEIKSKYASEFPELNLNEVEKTINRAKFMVSEHPLSVLLEKFEQQSVAVNDPGNQTITINRSRWKELRDDLTRRTVAFHEVLGLMGLEGTGTYTLSARYQALRILDKELPLQERTLREPAKKTIDSQSGISIGTGVEIHQYGFRILLEMEVPGSKVGNMRYFVAEGRLALGGTQDYLDFDSQYLRVTPVEINPFAVDQEILSLQMVPISFKRELVNDVDWFKSIRAVGVQLNLESPYKRSTVRNEFAHRFFADIAISALGYASAIMVDGKVLQGDPVSGQMTLGYRMSDPYQQFQINFFGMDKEEFGGSTITEVFTGFEGKLGLGGYALKFGNRSFQAAGGPEAGYAFLRLNVEFRY